MFENPPGGREPSFELIEAGYTAFDDRIVMIEINQALSYGFDTSTGEFYVITNFVAGKDTGVFIALNTPDAKSVYLSSYMTIERNGAVLGYMIPSAMPDDYTLLFQPRELESVGNWAQGGYTFRLFIDDVEAAVRTANFFDTKPIKVLAVPIKANYSGRVAQCTGRWQISSEWLIATFPVARANVEYVLGPELDCSANRYDLNTQAGITGLWQAVCALQTPTNDYTLIVGFIPEVANNGRYMGWTCGMPANIVVEDSPSMVSVVSHEVSHCYSVGDEYPGGSLNPELNMPPYRMEGHNIFTGRSEVGVSPYVISGRTNGLNGTGSIVYPEQRAYHASARLLLGTVLSYMSSVSSASHEQFWTTSDIYNHLFNVLAGNYGDYVRPRFWGVCPSCFSDVYDPQFMCKCDSCGTFAPVASLSDNNYRCPSCSRTGTITWGNCYLRCGICDELVLYEWVCAWNNSELESASGTEAYNARVLQVSGTLSSSGVFIPSPWYSYEIPTLELTAKADGEYAIYFYDSGGGQIGLTYFDVEFIWQINTAEGQEFLQTDNATINIQAIYPDGAARIVIKQGDRELYSVNVSSTAPEVSFTGLAPNQLLDNNCTLTWTASGSSDNLYFDIWYCPAEGELYKVASNVTGRSYDADLSTFPGTNGGYFRIYATDGAVTGEAESVIIRVPYKAPIILNDSNCIGDIKVTDEILIFAEIFDMQDGWLHGDSAYWYIDDDPNACTENFILWVFPYMLLPGDHVFICEATNSAGMVTRKEFPFSVVFDESDLPDDWSHDSVMWALVFGFYQPLDRLDAQISRAEFAVLMYNLYVFLQQENVWLPPYVPGLVTDCGPTDYLHYSQFLMVNLGLMKAPDGVFSPGRPLTEREAAIILFRMIAPYSEDLMAVYDDEDMIIYYLGQMGILDDAGPNSLKPFDNLTCKLALVRIYRVLDIIVTITYNYHD